MMQAVKAELTAVRTSSEFDSLLFKVWNAWTSMHLTLHENADRHDAWWVQP